eukprot:g41706.t1
MRLITAFKGLCKDISDCTTLILHDADVGETPAIRQHPRKAGPIQKEINYMLEQQVLESSSSSWSSPDVLVFKLDSSTGLCINYRTVNTVARAKFYPISQLVASLDRV